VAGIVIRGGKFLIARRLAGGDQGGKWEFPGGKAEEGESPGAALVREYGEEFGVAAEAGEFLAEASFEHRGTLRTLRAYRVRLNPEHISLREHSEWRWASPEEIPALDFAPSDLKLLPALKAYVDGNPQVQE
jgi:8-oxo-dGTP diphosphatase